MKDNFRNNNIFNLCFTTYECQELINAVEHALQTKYDSNTDFFTELSKYIPFEIRRDIDDILKNSHVNPNIKEELIGFFTENLKILKSAPVFTITLAFFPTYPQIKKITNWLRSEINPSIVLRVKVDHKILAGAIFEWQGESSHYTLKENIDKILAK